MLGKTVCPPVGAWLAREVAAHLAGGRDIQYVDEAVFWCASDPVRIPPEPAAPAGRALAEAGLQGDSGEGSLSAQADGSLAAPEGAQRPQKRLTNTVSKPRVPRAQVASRAPEEGWAELPGPTALARILIARGEGDADILAATKAVFGGRTEGPHLFTSKDLERLRERIAKNAAREAATA
jgi:hypothetical protein